VSAFGINRQVVTRVTEQNFLVAFISTAISENLAWGLADFALTNDFGLS
jgi:hypothetical protein